MDFPIMSLEAQMEMSNTDLRYIQSHRTRICLAAADLAGSRMSKVRISIFTCTSKKITTSIQYIVWNNGLKSVLYMCIMA